MAAEQASTDNIVFLLVVGVLWAAFWLMMALNVRGWRSQAAQWLESRPEGPHRPVALRAVVGPTFVMFLDRAWLMFGVTAFVTVALGLVARR
jgi:hypothetical protein